MERLNPNMAGATPDTVRENVERVKAIFPEVFIDGKIDFDALRAALGEYVDRGPERFSFTWNGKSRARQLAQTPSLATLRPCPEESVNWDTTQNLFIEGENLEVLKLLQKSYHRQIKLIFIDPPYNTGKDFIYPDRYQDPLQAYLRFTGQTDDQGFRLSANTESSGRYHTNWLNMIYPRLQVARNLLREDGAIFISIDDTEVANLRKLCDEVFGEENFVANLVWQKKYTRANDARWFSDNHDHILCYARNKEAFAVRLLPRSGEQLAAYANPDRHPKGPWKATPLHAKSGTDNSEYRFRNGVRWRPPAGTFRRYNDESLRRMEENDEIWFGEDGRQTPQRKSFLCDVKEGVTPTTLWTYAEVGHNHEANNELKQLGLDGVFSNPKPTRLIRQICLLTDTDDRDGIVLDFFAGSATTAHAVLAQNVADGGTRRFIMVQLPEPCGEHTEAYRAGLKSIAEIGKERIRRAIGTLKGTEADLGFKVFKLDSSNLKPWAPDTHNLERSLLDALESIKPGRSERDVLYEVLLKYGLDLAAPVEERRIHGSKVLIAGAGALVVCLSEEISLSVVSGIAALKAELGPAAMRVVFKDAGFQDDVVKTNATQILRQAGIDEIKSL